MECLTALQIHPEDDQRAVREDVAPGTHQEHPFHGVTDIVIVIRSSVVVINYLAADFW